MDKLLIIANILELITFILIVIAIVFTKKASKKTKEIISYYEDLTSRLFNETQDLKHLKLQQEHKNRILRNLVEEIENIVYGKRSSDEKVDKVIEVIKSTNSNNF